MYKGYIAKATRGLDLCRIDDAILVGARFDSETSQFWGGVLDFVNLLKCSICSYHFTAGACGSKTGRCLTDPEDQDCDPRRSGSQPHAQEDGKHHPNRKHREDGKISSHQTRKATGSEKRADESRSAAFWAYTCTRTLSISRTNWICALSSGQVLDELDHDKRTDCWFFIMWCFEGVSTNIRNWGPIVSNTSTGGVAWPPSDRLTKAVSEPKCGWISAGPAAKTCNPAQCFFGQDLKHCKNTCKPAWTNGRHLCFPSNSRFISPLFTLCFSLSLSHQLTIFL